MDHQKYIYFPILESRKKFYSNVAFRRRIFMKIEIFIGDLELFFVVREEIWRILIKTKHIESNFVASLIHFFID